MAAGSARPQITLALHPQSDLYHLSTLLTGLRALHRAGDIRFDVAVAPTPDSTFQTVYRLLARASPDRPVMRCAVDLADRCDFWDVAELEEADVYFKRSYWSTRPPPVTERARAAVQAFGLNHACRSPDFPLGVAARMGWAMIRHAGRQRSAAYVRRCVRTLRAYLESPAAATYQVPQGAPREPKVVFQTRLWGEHEVGPGLDGVNDERLALVRALRQAFGNRFVGGVIRTPVSERLCPDAISPLPSAHRAYAAWSRTAMIGVYTRGLHDSLAFKLAEYMANGKAIVAAGIPAAALLPAPLTEGREYVPFTDTASCLAACERLLSRPAAAEALGRQARGYYQRECSPVATARRILRAVGC